MSGQLWTSPLTPKDSFLVCCSGLTLSVLNPVYRFYSSCSISSRNVKNIDPSLLSNKLENIPNHRKPSEQNNLVSYNNQSLQGILDELISVKTHVVKESERSFGTSSQKTGLTNQNNMFADHTKYYQDAVFKAKSDH
ncbi:hypothetical protein AMECASPLE_029407 [Ameca splendens]|uniref:Uncharacterized protein n=1 Tax=Ameca splendens TaxID=208324 RepID=A0ABV0XUU3_9TELE